MEDFVQSLKELSAIQLMDKKNSIEREIQDYMEVLQSQGAVGMEGVLVDPEGYPRNDIDVYAVRTARNKVIRLQNDHKAVMAEIEQKLHQIHAEKRESHGPREEGMTASQNCSALGTGFAKVNSVAQGSPAAHAGLLVGDVLVEFGSVKRDSFKSLQDVGVIVQHSVGKPVRVVVSRNQRQLPLSLTPQQWSGRGLLGCNIVPL